MKKNTGIPYEKITRQIFSDLLDRDGFSNIDVKHNVNLQGKTTNHQIDVYWQFKLGNVNYETVIQAKDWTSRVNKGELLKFAEILKDLPNQPRGIFVTKSGYQSGAKEVAKKNGILIYELREPTSDEIEANFKDLIVEYNSYLPFVDPINFIQDMIWLDEELKKLNIDKPEEILFKGNLKEILFYDKQFNPIGNYHEFLEKVAEHKFEEIAPTVKEYYFESDTFIKNDDKNLKYLKILGFNAKFWIDKHTIRKTYKAQDIVSFVLENLSENETQFFDQNLRRI